MQKLPLQVWKDEKAPAIALLILAVSKYGVQCMMWYPAILRSEIESDYNIKLSDLQSDKLQAAITILTTNMFEDQWEAFEKCCHLLNNQPIDFEDLMPLEAEEIISALAHAELIMDGQEEGLQFSQEVRAYAGHIFYEYGCSEAPVLFPTAIIPGYANKENSGMPEKNAALRELYDAKIAYLKEYVADMMIPEQGE